MEPIQFTKLDPDAITPVYFTAEAAGADLFALEDKWIKRGQTQIIRTGIAMELPVGLAGFVLSRSGLAAKHGIAVLNAPGLIDSDYRGEIQVILHNTGSRVSNGDDGYLIEKGSRIAQLVIQPFVTAQFQLVAALSDSVRGAGGLGSTGY